MSAVWNDKLIRSALEVGRDDLLPIAWVPEERLDRFGPVGDWQVQPASLDVRLGPEFVEHPSGSRLYVTPDAAYSLMPGDCVLGSLVEAVAIPDNAVARVEGKSTWARHFLTVHSAGFIDPGFRGDITLELKNDGKLPLILEPGRSIAQLSFLWLAAPAGRPYGSDGLGSHYQYQKGPTEPV